MDIGLRIAASALSASEQGVGVYANDLVNANTTAFDPATPVFAGLPASLLSSGPFPSGVNSPTPPYLSVGNGTTLAATQLTVGSEPVVETGIPTDVAPSGQGFFMVKTPAGPAFTRDGSFTVDGAGTLVSQSGYPVYSTAGLPITVPPGSGQVSIDSVGRVLAGGKVVGQIGEAQFPNPSGLVSIGQNLFVAGQGAQASAGPVSLGAWSGLHSGALLGSGTNVGAELAGLIQLERSFQMDATAATNASQMLDWAAKLG